VLKQELTPPTEDPKKWLILVHGESGVGKTSWAAQIPGHYFVRTEEGCKGLFTYGETVASWGQFVNELVGEILKGANENWEGQRRVETLIIDVVEKLWWLCAEWIAKNKQFMVRGVAQSFTDVRHVPYGLGYSDTTTEFMRVIRLIQRVGIGVVLLSHTNYRHFKWGTEDLRRAEPDFSAGTVDEIVGECDAVGYFAIDEKVKKENQGGDLVTVSIEQGRFQYWQPQFLRIAKHRFDLPAAIPFPKYKGWSVYCEEFEKGATHERERQMKTSV
jgi:hypothetical protein